jgi:hypothetical protein
MAAGHLRRRVTLSLSSFVSYCFERLYTPGMALAEIKDQSPRGGPGENPEGQ